MVGIWVVIGVLVGAAVVAKARVLPARVPPATLPLPRAGRSRHPRLELELHDHAHVGLQRTVLRAGDHAGWTVHVGLGRRCLCVDFYRHGRRP